MKAASVKKQSPRSLTRRASTSPRQPKPTKKIIAQTWAKLTGIVNTGETDLSTREGLGIFEYVPPSQVGDFKFSATHIKLSNTLGDTL